MNPGLFRHKITFLAPPEGRNAYGEPDGGWTPALTVYASIEPILGKELYAALTANSGITAKIRTRFIDGINDKMRIRHGGDIYVISSLIDVEGRRREALMYCVRM
jgi:SPP1 family predicted phage head-tail adaptor